ncbi:MAG: molybdopterin-guanine dinucleotide biosynthesis protein B [Candidatus Thorarchaeota archaeon]
MQVFAVSGFSFSGKTFLLEQLISKLKEEGKSVASIKSTKEDIIAPEGTDTWRHAQAGANPTLLIGPSTATMRARGKTAISKFAKIIDVDYLLLEGFKELEVPRFWCIGEEIAEEQFSPSNVKAYVVWEGVDLGSSKDGVPIIPNSDIQRLVAILKEEAIDYFSINGIS